MLLFDDVQFKDCFYEKFMFDWAKIIKKVKFRKSDI